MRRVTPPFIHLQYASGVMPSRFSPPLRLPLSAPVRVLGLVLPVPSLGCPLPRAGVGKVGCIKAVAVQRAVAAVPPAPTFLHRLQRVASVASLVCVSRSPFQKRPHRSHRIGAQPVAPRDACRQAGGAPELERYAS